VRLRKMDVGLRGTLAAVTTVAVFGCGPSPITSARIDRAIEPTFANLVHVQLSRLGLPSMAASDIKVTASCRKVVAGNGAAGAGDWVCTLSWQRPNRQTLRDTYDLSVATDGCYTATVDSAEGHLGGPTLKASDGSDVRNLLYTFEGCFDTN
jgi:hypothetical protein